jgi:hypothetical protein
MKNQQLALPGLIPSAPSAHRPLDRQSMSDAISSFGRFRSMRQYMGEDVPAAIVQKCLEVAGDTSLADIKEILHHRCWRGCEPGTVNGPHRWAWFPAVIAGEVQSRSRQAAAALDSSRKKHWSEYSTVPEPDLDQGISSFCSLDDSEAPA